MKYTAAITLLSATIAAAAPTPSSTTILGYAVPSVVKIHSINTNINHPDQRINTIRSGTYETSTLFDIPIPASAAGRTCGLVVRAQEGGDVVSGAGSLDVFKNLFTDLASLEQGNQRDQLLARVVFDPATGLYDFKRGDVTPKIDAFPCPAGQTLHWEAAAVGELDVNIVAQDSGYAGAHVPNGLSVAWW
ncbi:hypothetical protein F5Y14DRAFT_318945 [Nemania sp. NC0429]|nr:hypothetical protein F5Y14DRAFT_318945 [Nemania sp. NC0429]